MSAAPETLSARRPGVCATELWIGASLVALIALAYLAAPGLDAHMTGASIRDLIRVRGCSPAAPAPDRTCHLSTITDAGKLIHGTLWMRLLVFAEYRLRFSVATQAAVMSAAVAAAAGVVFAFMRPIGGRLLAGWTAAVFVGLTGVVQFPEFTNAYIAFLPAAGFFLALSRISAGASLRWCALAGAALFPCVEAHVSSLVLVPTLLWVVASSPGAPLPGLMVALAGLLTPALILSPQNYAQNLVAEPLLTEAFFGGCLLVLVVAGLARRRWLGLALELRLGATALATVAGCYAIGVLVALERPWPRSSYYLIPLLPLLASVIAGACHAGLRMMSSLPGRLVVAGGLGVILWDSRDEFLMPLVATAVGLLLLAGLAVLSGRRGWAATIALAGGAWVLSGLTQPAPWHEPDSLNRLALTGLAVLVDAGWQFAGRRSRNAARADAQDRIRGRWNGARLGAMTMSVLTSGVCVFMAAVLVERHGVWANNLWSGEATVEAAQALSTCYAGHGWDCEAARMRQGLAVWNGDRHSPYECMLLMGVSGPVPTERSEAPDPTVIRALPATDPSVVPDGLPGWDTVALGHGRRVLVSSIVPWVRRDLGQGEVDREGVAPVRFAVRPLWRLDDATASDNVFGGSYPLNLTRLAGALDARTLARAGVRFDFPIRMSGADPLREIDLSNEAMPETAWRIDHVEGVEHTLDPSGLHVTIRRSLQTVGTISLTRTANGDQNVDDAPIEWLETRAEESAARELFRRPTRGEVAERSYERP